MKKKLPGKKGGGKERERVKKRAGGKEQSEAERKKSYLSI